MSTGNKLRFSVLIVGYNSQRFLFDCLTAALAADHPAFEVLFLDNGSPQPEAQWVRANFMDSRLRVFDSEQNLFFAGGVNMLARAARGEILVLLNPDTRVDAGWLKGLEECFVLGYAAAQAQLKHLRDDSKGEPPGYFIDKYAFIVHARPPADGKPAQIFGGRGAGLAIRREVFVAIGAMDEVMEMYFEETDLCWRINLFGGKVAFAPAAVVYHLVGGSSHPTFFRWSQYRFIRNRIWSLLKNYELSTLVRVLPLHVALTALSALRNALALRPGLAVTEAAALVRPWFKATYILAKRRRVQSFRKVRDTELMAARLILPEGKYGRRKKLP